MNIRFLFSLLFVALSSPLLSSCSSDTEGGGLTGRCTLEARSSVTVKVMDKSGAVVADATVTFSVDGGPVENCEAFSDGGTFVCGFERTGKFTITATKGMDTKTATITVNNEPDGCHVESQSITITLGA